MTDHSSPIFSLCMFDQYLPEAAGSTESDITPNLLSKIANGTYGSIFDDADNSSNVVKVIPLKFNPKKEFDILLGLEHPNIVKVVSYSTCWQQGNGYITMERAKCSLKTFYSSHTMTKEILLDFSRQIVTALVHVHSKNIVHHDIKPENILFFGTDVFKLCDFGASDVIDCFGEEISGTITYMSPEYARTQKVTFADDIWAFGATLLEMITTKCPYHDYKSFDNCLSPFMLVSKIAQEPELIKNYFPKSLDPVFKAVLDLCFSPESRRPSACELLTYLKTIQ